MRRSIALLLASVVAASLATTSVQAQEGPPVVPDQVNGYVIMPPGQSGKITALGYPQDDFGPHFSDQLEMYASLVQDDDVTDEELLDYFRPFQFDAGEIESTYSPTEGVTVYRDTFGVPHIYADTADLAAFGSGYVTAEDRLFQMDAFRHAARGTLASFVGPGENDSRVQSDIATRREGYTEAEVQAMFDALDDKYGEIGLALQTGSQAYADGVNAYMDEVRSDPLNYPFEYTGGTSAMAPDEPTPWTPLDTMFIAILQLRVFGETAGSELQNAAFYQHVTNRLGKKKGRAIYDELLFQNEPKSPTTIPADEADFKTQKLGDVDWSSVAIPDNAEELGRKVAREERIRAGLLEALGFKKQASNALLVSAEKSTTGNPLLLGGPQVGHALPSFFLDMDVHAPGIDFRGPAVPGTSALIPLGRGTDYAWTLTTGYSDAVDVRAEKLCDPEGAEPTLQSNSYMFEGECVEMEAREETIEINPPPTEPGPPSSETHTFYRTIHGPVFQRALVKGKPVAFVKQRFFWMKEIDSLPSFYRWNTGIESLEDFTAAAEDFTMSFNSFYADAEHIAYLHVGEYPVRTKHVSPSLPIWGTGEWEWKDERRNYELQPKIIDPEQGWVANWNNKPALGWDNQDGFKWGSIQRVHLLQDRMHALLDAGTATVSDIVDVIRDAATRDARGVYLGQIMINKAIKRLGDDPETEAGQALGIVQAWIDAGSHRANLDRDETMDDGTALAIFDTWYDKLVHNLFDDELGEDGYGLMTDAPIVNYTPENGGGFWFDFSSYVFNLIQRKYRVNAFSYNYCDRLDTKDGKEPCNAVVAASLLEALLALEEAQGEDMSAWTLPAENISFTNNANSATGGFVDDIPWQNRGSENHIVEVLDPAP